MGSGHGKVKDQRQVAPNMDWTRFASRRLATRSWLICRF